MANHVHHLLLSVIPQEHRWKIILFQQWESIIGSLKDKVKIEKIQNDALFLTVSHPSWAHELLMLSGLLRKKINNALQEERIKTIRFSSSSFKPTPESPSEKNSSLFIPLSPQEEITSVTLNAQERKTLDHVPCDDLRSVLEQFFVRCHKTKLRINSDEPKKTGGR